MLLQLPLPTERTLQLQNCRTGKYRLVMRVEGCGVANVVLELGVWPSGGFLRSFACDTHATARDRLYEQCRAKAVGCACGH